MLRARRYFQLSFFLPLVLPLLAALILTPGFDGWSLVVLVLLFSLQIGSVPYVLFLAGLFYWARDKDFNTIRRATYVAPLLFIPVFVYCALALIPLQILETGEVRIEGNGILALCLIILGLGYLYVLLANAGFYLLKAFDCIEEESGWDRVPESVGARLGRKKYLLALALLLPLLLIPVSMFIRNREQKNYPKRIDEANRTEVSVNRDTELIEIAFEQAEAQRHDDARATVASYVEDKDRGFASIVTAQVYGGAYEEARATARLIAAPVRQIMSYSQIAVAQAKAGDGSEARQNLSTALEIANRAGNESLKRFTLPIIVAGQAEAGFDDELKTTLAMVEPSELIDTYKTVAAIKASDGKIKEAQAYFREALKQARGSKDPMLRDSRLAGISDAQADAGLLDDARATVEVIAQDSYRKSALYHISIVEDRDIKGQQH